MPQIQFLPEAPSFSSQLAEALGGGLGKGLSQGLEKGVELGLQKQVNQFNRLQKHRSQLTGEFSKYNKLFGYDKSLGDEVRRDLLKKAESRLEEGYDPFGAISSVYDDYLRDIETQKVSEPAEEKGFNALKALIPLGALDEIGEFLKQRETPEGPTRAQSLLGAPVKGALSATENVPFSPQALAHMLTGTAPPESPLKQFFPTQDKPAERMLETAGRVAPLAFAGPGGIPMALAEIGTAAAGREIAKQLDAPEIVQDLAEIAGFSLPGLTKFALGKVGKVLKTRGISPPKIKEITFKPGEVPASATGPVTGEEVLDEFSKIVNDSVKNLEGRGVTLDMINSGDPKAISELQKEASKLSGIYKEADKMNLKAYEKQRQDILKKLPESPLEKYYAPVKETKLSPERQVLETERIKPLETIIKQNERRARDLQYQILSADQEVRAGKLSPAEIERVRATRDSNALAHQRALNEIKNAKFEIKYGRPPQTSENIQLQIENTFDQLRQGIKDPNAPKVQAFKKGIERDKHLVEEAKKLLDRGEIPGPQVFDEYIKIHEQYLKSYEDLIKELTDFVKENASKARMGPKVKRAEDLLNTIKQTKDISKAKIALQRDKRQVQNILGKPSGAFYKNALRDLKKDIGDFQKDFFTWSKIAQGPEVKVAEVAKKTIKAPPEVSKKEFKRTTQPAKEPPKVQKKFFKTDVKEGIEAGQAAAKNPTEANIKNAADKSGMAKEEYRDFFKKISDKMKTAGEKVKTGEASPKEEMSIFNDILAKYKKLPKLIQIPAGGVILGTVQALSEEYLGYKPPAVAVGAGLGALGPEGKGLVRGAGIGYIGNQVYKYLRDGFTKKASEELKRKRGNPKEFESYYKKLREKYGDTRANKIRKMAIQS